MVNSTRFAHGLAVAAAVLALVLFASLGTGHAYAAALQAGSVAVEPQEESAISTAEALPDAAVNDLVNGHVYVLYSSVGGNKVLDVSGASPQNGANAQIYEFNRSAAQQWRCSKDSNGYVTLTCLASGKVLDVSYAGNVNYTNVWQYESNSTAAQKWSVSKNVDGTYKMSSALGNKMVLDVDGAGIANGTNVQVYTDNGTAAQKWRFFDVTSMRTSLDAKAKSSKSPAAGTYFIRSSIDHWMVMDVSGGSGADCANVQLYRLNWTSAQKWVISYDSMGYETIKNGSGKVLDVSCADLWDGTNVQQYASNSTLAQKWIVSMNPDGTYTLQSALWQDYVVDLAGAAVYNGSNIQTYTANYTNAQKWEFSPEDSVPRGSVNIKSSSISNSFNGISLADAKAVGIDVSYWNGDIDWRQVRDAGIDFAIIRCGYGSDYSNQDDSKFYQNVRGAREAGLDIGVYLYSYAPSAYGMPSADSEADHTLRLLRSAGLSPSDLKYGVYLDVEDSSQEDAPLESISTTYCDKIRAAGYEVGVYSGLYWWNNKLYASSFNNYNRWVAQWPYKTGNRRCDYGGSYVLWQCMSDGSVPGIYGNVDMNLAYY